MDNFTLLNRRDFVCEKYRTGNSYHPQDALKIMKLASLF